MQHVKNILLSAVLILLGSCSKESSNLSETTSLSTPLGHDAIVLGRQLDNPYTTDNMTKAYLSLYPTKAPTRLKTTHYYVRFHPMDRSDVDHLLSLGLQLYDHPVDFEIKVDGDYYHDPAIEEGRPTYQYAVVPVDFPLGQVQYEILDECFIVTSSAEATKAGLDENDAIDWAAVEREAFILSGNGDMICSAETKGGGEFTPKGQITICDPKWNAGKPFGLSGVKVQCNVFVKFTSAFTDRDGNYCMSRSFAKNPRYRIVFENEKGFSQGINLVLVQGSVSALGTHSPKGYDYCITADSDLKMYRRACVNNAAYDYYCRCDPSDMNLPLPPSNLRIWNLTLFNGCSAPMAHRGTLTSAGLLKQWLGQWAKLVDYFLPDIIIGVKNGSSYSSIYESVVHELAHASHYSQVGNEYWAKYVDYVLNSFITDGFECYGSAENKNSGYCAVGECWAYYLSSMMYQERYGGSTPAFGNAWWFRPQIFRTLDDRGFHRSQIMAVLEDDIVDMQSMWEKMLSLYPSSRNIINQTFSTYLENTSYDHENK